MSGHSKWSKVKHQKATTDVVKAKAFTKASRGITIAVREGGGQTNPDDNFRLRLAIEKAKEVNMPKENIERAIAKGKGEGGQAVESLVYEAYGPQGTAFLIEAATENKQRTVSMIKNALDHHHGSLASPGSVAYQFQRIAVVMLSRPQTYSDEELFSIACDAGVDDVQFFDDAIEITTSVDGVEGLRKTLDQKAIQADMTEFYYVPTIPISLNDETDALVTQLLEALQELEDVQKVHTNIQDG